MIVTNLVQAHLSLPPMDTAIQKNRTLPTTYQELSPLSTSKTHSPPPSFVPDEVKGDLESSASYVVAHFPTRFDAAYNRDTPTSWWPVLPYRNKWQGKHRGYGQSHYRPYTSC